MKKVEFPLASPVHWFWAVALSLVLSSCMQYYEYTEYIPVFRDMSEFRGADAIRVPDSIPPLLSQELGKIALSADRQFLFVNERNQGVRVADISDPHAPRWLGFIEIPGNMDLIFLEWEGSSLLYVDSYIDLVVLELTLPGGETDSLAAREIHRMEGVFPQNPFQVDRPDTPWPFWIPLTARDNDQIVVGWETRTVSGWETMNLFGGAVMVDSATSGGAGAVGSMSRFALYADPQDQWYLYTVDQQSLRTFSLEAGSAGQSPGLPLPESSQFVGWDIETIFPYGNTLFLGSSSALYIYNLATGPNSSPTAPEQLSLFWHLTARDPVVVGPVGALGEERDTAFVTLRSDGFGGENLLIAVDVSDPSDPVELIRRSMFNPHGLGLLDSQTLFVCEGSGGIKVVNVSRVHDTEADLDERLHTQTLGLATDFETFDMIPGTEVQIFTGPRELRFYGYTPGDESTDTGSLTQFSRLEL